MEPTYSIDKFCDNDHGRPMIKRQWAYILTKSGLGWNVWITSNTALIILSYTSHFLPSSSCTYFEILREYYRQNWNITSLLFKISINYERCKQVAHTDSTEQLVLWVTTNSFQAERMIMFPLHSTLTLTIRLSEALVTVSIIVAVLRWHWDYNIGS